VEFPKKVLSFYRLEELYLGNNKIKHIPWGMNRLRKLKILHLENNEIDFIPNTVGKLQYLTDLSIIPNPLDSINDENTLLACHNGHTRIVQEFLLFQEIPKNYPFKEDIVSEINKKEEKLRSYTDDQKLIRKILKEKKFCEVISTFMDKEHSTENILFWKDVNRFSIDFSSDIEITTAELVERAKTLFCNYISEESIHPINLPAEITADLRKIFTDTFIYPKGINQWVFKPATRAILDLMSRDTFRRFKATPEGVEVLQLVAEKDSKDMKHKLRFMKK